MSTIPANSFPEQAIQFMGETYTAAGLDSLEVQTFTDQLSLLVGAPGSIENQLFQLRKDAILSGLRIIKYKLKNPAFRGFFANDNELSWGLIRPQHTASGGTYAAPTKNTTWSVALTTSFADWLFSAAATAFNLGNIDHGYGLVILGIKSALRSPLVPAVSEVDFKLDRKQTIVFDVRDLPITDNDNQVPIVPIPTMVALPDSDVYAKIRGDLAQTEEVALCGVTIGLGRFLKTE